MESGSEHLLRFLEVEQLDANYFRGYSPEGPWPRIFGGQVLGQALMAAGRTLETTDRVVHSLQSYFLLAGDPQVPIMFEVDRIRDGRSFTTRRVRAFQKGDAIFALSASFHVTEDGPEHQPPAPDVPGPEAVDGGPGPFARARQEWGVPFDFRWIDRPERSEQMMWLRADGPLPDDPLVHASLLAYASDFGLVSVIAQPHTSGTDWPTGFMMASLDHTMWFHRPFRVDEWLLYARHSPTATGARGLAFGAVTTEDGTLVASVAQEGLVRPRRER